MIMRGNKMEKIARDEFEKKVIDLLVRSSLYELPSKRKDLLIILKAIASQFKDGSFTEKETNEIIKDFISKIPRLKVDHVKIRRALIDEGFLKRTPSGSVYTIDKDYDAFKLFSEDINNSDCLNLIRNAQKEIEERKKKYTQ